MNSTSIGFDLWPTVEGFAAATDEPLTTTREAFVDAIKKNVTNIEPKEIYIDRSFLTMMSSLVFAMIWVIYISYYNSRIVGYFITKALNRFFMSEGYATVGSFTLCALSGKIMFRDITYITKDYSVRVQDGWMIFRWWRAYVPKDVSEDLSHSDTRLSVMLNGFELHVFNRSAVYGNLEHLFDVDPVLFPWDTALYKTADERQEHDPGGAKLRSQLGQTWRDLIPVIKVDVSSGRLVFGNRLVPTTLSVLVEEAHFVYSTKPAASRLDHFMHFAKCKAENFKVILAPSPKYHGISDEPPRYMGEGFVVLSSNNVELYYYMDEPGLVPEEPEMLQLANGDIVESAPPIWGMDIKCGKGTDFSYGPWADRQREHLFKFFFPQDFQPLKVTKAPLPGEKRMVQSFDIRLSTLHESTIDILFSKNKETNAVHVNIGPGSYMEMTMPWVVSPDGYTTKVTGQLLHVEATTSLTYRSLMSSETLEFALRSRYPIKWNGHQEWLLHLTGCKATVWFIYAHKEFFQDMVNDWSCKARPDLLYFVPYTWRINVLLKEFEFILPCNEYNWIDCSSQSQENMCIAFCGELFDFSFDLPFVDFLPASLPLRFWIQGESMDLSMYLPEVFTTHCIALALDRNAKLLGRDGNIMGDRHATADHRKWRNKCQRSNGWLDCWSVPIVALSINYTYHPMPPYGPAPQADITTPEKEEILLSPMRIPRSRKSPALHHWRQQSGCPKFDPASLPPDRVSLELEIGPSVMLVYGAWIRAFVNLKENIFGDDQSFTDMNDKPETPASGGRATGPGVEAPVVVGNGAGDDDSASTKDFDPREYRPLDVVVSITMHDVHAHLVKNCNEDDPPCPIILLERFGFEMKKGYKETQLQLLLSPAILLSSDRVSVRGGRDTHLAQGHLMLSGLQVRGQAMFSDEGRGVDQETLEYAWLLEIQLGRLTGKMTTPQIHHLVTGLETLLMLLVDSENRLVPARSPPPCHHGLSPPSLCADSDPHGTYRCPSPDDIKYRMVRVAVDAIDLYVLESGTAINIYAAPIRVSTCNLHGHQVRSGMTAVVPNIRVRQTVAVGNHFGGHATATGGSTSNTNTTGSGRSQHARSTASSSGGDGGGGGGGDLWLEVGSLSLGPLVVEAAVSLSNTDRNLHLVQHKYLKTHDEKSKRLWFLWTTEKATTSVGKCGCIGGCVFFGKNRNGQHFFKPSRQDAAQGINIAAFRINETGKDPGFGQSILHEAQLVFHTPPYNSHDVTIHEPPHHTVKHNHNNIVKATVERERESSPRQSRVERSRSVTDTNKESPVLGGGGAAVSPGGVKTTLGRRFSYTSVVTNRNAANGGQSRDVPYARLVDSSPTTKLDSDSRLHSSERTRSILSVPEAEAAPKSSVSDSKLAVDYFNTTAQAYNALINSVNCAASSVMSSESEHSLMTGAGAVEVERTVSLCSENQSEAFFSAEEELSGGGGVAGSRTSSLRHSLGVYRTDSQATKKLFGSDMSIVAGSTGSVGAGGGGVGGGLSSHRSDHEIHTPEHRSNARLELSECEQAKVGVSPLMRHHRAPQPRSISPRYAARDSLDAQESALLLLDSSDTHSVSSTSFISAVSSQEDLALVNLHMQVNKPIVESPLLMSSYVNHLSQVGCANWSQSSLPQGSDAFTVPLFQRTDDGRLVYVGSKYTPRFETLVEGFTSLKMVGRHCGGSGGGQEGEGEGESPPGPPSSKTPTHPYCWDRADLAPANDGDAAAHDQDMRTGVDEELLSSRNESGSRTTLVVKMKGDIDIMVSPLALESLQRFIDAATPTLVTLHPLSVLNHLHLCCSRRVEAANVLKRDKYLGQLTGGGSKRSTAERTTATAQTQAHGVYEECIATQIQGTITLPKVNIALLQASVVEEVIAFSALDNLRDLTCVSLLAVAFDGVTARFHYAKQAREVVQTFQRPAVLPGGQKKQGVRAFLLGHQASQVKDILTGEPVYIETSEKQQEESVVTLRINKIHSQLRRLRNESTILKDAVITAIPAHCSRVMFTTCSNTPPPPPPPPQQPTEQVNNDDEDNVNDNSAPPPSVGLPEDKLGFIMFECGLEGVSLKVVKRSKFDKEEDEMKNFVGENETNYTDSVRSKEDIEVSVVNETGKLQQPPTLKHGPSRLETPNSAQNSGADMAQVENATEAATSGTAAPNTAVASKGKDGNASSCVVEVKQVWFNFAAPPRAPITRKIDYTRLDWNLLSTASPAINAWMNPSNRFAIRVVHMLRCRYRRATAIVTCLMAQALDVQAVHVPVKSRYGRLTPLSVTLQEDPSCQLCTVLQRYVLRTTGRDATAEQEDTLEDNLHEADVPHLSTLRQGVIVLSRQWKNILYTPLLLEHNFKSKNFLRKPMNVTFAIPDPDEENGAAVLTDGEGEGSGEECEVTDECAMLLNQAGAGHHGLHKVLKAAHKQHAMSAASALPLPSVVSPGACLGPPIAAAQPSPHHLTPIDSLVFSSPTSPNSVQQGGTNKKRCLPPSQLPSSSRASIVFPLLATGSSTSHPFVQQHRRADSHGAAANHTAVFGTSGGGGGGGGYTTLKDGGGGSQPGSVTGAGPDSQPSLASLDHDRAGGGGGGGGEDLYTWMAKHQEFDEAAPPHHPPGVVNKAVFWSEPASSSVASATAAPPVVVNPDSLLLMASAGYSLYPMHDSLRLLDAHLIFEPLLSSLGVMPQQMITNTPGSGNNTLDSWGSNLSLVGGMEAMRIDIVVSEFGKPQDKRPRSNNKNKSNESGKQFWLDLPPETPAFVCERVGVELEVCRAADMTVVEDLSRQRRNMLYVSRGQLKKHSSTALNLSVSVRYIAQQVNMPLLRLLHQISNMYQNVKETQTELKEQQPPAAAAAAAANTANGTGPGSDAPDLSLPLLTTVPDLDRGTIPLQSHRPVVSPSSSVRSSTQRHTSFAQRLRSTGKSVRGYLNLGDGGAQSSAGLAASKDEGAGRARGAQLPRCWKTVYYLLDLYATMPETKTIAHSRFSVAGDHNPSEGYKGNRKYETLTEDVERGDQPPVSSTPIPPNPPRETVCGERTRLVVLAVAKIHRCRLLATLSGLKLEAEITGLHGSVTARRPLARPNGLECSVTGHVGRTMIVLLEGVAPNQQTVVRVTVGKSQSLYSSVSRRSGRDKNSGLLTIGAVAVDIPQHPVALHGMMTRGSKQLSSTLQELRVSRTSGRMSRGPPAEEGDASIGHPQQQPSPTGQSREPPRHAPAPPAPPPLMQPLVMQFSIVLQSLSVTAALLPSLQAQYKMDRVTGSGVTGTKAKLVVDLPHHSLSFSTKVQVTEANLPSEASIELPKVHVSAEYVVDQATGPAPPHDAAPFFGQDGVVLRHGNYVSAVAEIGTFEHSLTTDLLNHLVFVQKVFMKEVNEVVQKVYGGEKPVPLWLEDSDDSSSSSTVKQILFTLVIRIKRIQLTATTPTNCAVRLETGAVDFQLSNRVQNVCEPPLHSPLKVFGKAQVDVNLSLGQVIRNVLFEEAEPEFQQFAFFKTRIGVRNAFQGETGSGSGGKEVVLMTLKRPLIYVQPLAVDKAILVWLNYKNAYDYWAEQRSALNKEVLTATQQVFEKVPFEKLSTPHLGTLFLQLTVEDMGICVPLNPLPPPTWGGGRGGPYASCESDSCAAVVVTLESTSISACSSGSLVSNGRFVGLCLRFADDFETSLDDWKPADSEPEADAAMNLCVVSEGTYEVCSRTVAPAYDTDNAKWFLNVQWAMEGVDIHLDVNIGKQLSALGHTLTTLTSVQEEGGSGHDSDSELPDAGVDDHPVAHHDSQESGAASLSSSLDAKSRSRLIEKEMYEQAKIINDLRALGASHSTIEQEMKRLRELEAMVYKGFRRDMIQRLRRQSVKSSNKNKAGTFRSKSFIVPSPTVERHTEIESPDEAVVSMTSGSVDSSPRSGPSRSASLRAPRGLGTAHRVTFSDTHNMQRQASFPSASSELSLPVDDWPSDGFRSSLAVHKSSFGSADGSTLLLVEPDKEAAGGGGPRGGGTGGPQKPLEPNIDFELDVKVLINRGKCVLHTKDPPAPSHPPPDHDHSTGKMRMKKERSSSGGMFEFPPASPVASRRSQRDRHNASASSAVLAPHRRHLQPSSASSASYMQPADLTVFHIPGLDVKVHYESKTVLGDEGGGGGGSGGASGGRRSSAGTKKASLFAWTTLQSIPEETIISPHILEFLEQTLEPIPPAHTQHTFPSPTGASSKRAGLDEAVGPRDWAPSGGGQYAYASFPVDVIVYFHMQPSTFRFSCLPVSRVECMLKLPSLDIVFSSKRAETESTGLGGTIGGLSITGCLADFSVYIFHPYGGKKSGGKEAQWPLLADSERKDSLSVNVEFVKFHLSRSRKLNNNTADKTEHGSRAIIRFSTIIDIGSASFKYDMRRLTEILAFPKAWYRRSIVRRLFLGDFTAASRAPFSGDSSPDDIAGDYPDVGDTSESSPMLGPNRERDRERERLRLNLDLRRLDGRATTDQRGNRGGGSSSSSPSPGEAKTEATWETLVLFAVNFKRLNVHMNMGNVMGNVMWLTKNFRSEGRLSIGSTGHKNMFIGFGLGGSSLEAKGGIVGGTIELSKIDTFVLIREDPGTEPDHTVGLKLASLELRLDYMGTAVLMCRVSALDVSLRDEWKMADRDKANADAYNPTRRSAMIFVHGDLGWDQLQLMISKSTTVDLLKMYYKLDEFFSQQFKSSKRVFSALGGGTGGFQRRHRKRSDRAPPQPPQPTAAGTTADGAWVGGQDARHHRHWQPILSAVAGLRGGGGVGGGQPLPPSGTVLGGTMELHGTHVSLACFHGINFKSKSWALFSLKEPCISFTTEAQEVHSLDSAVSLDVHIVQTLTFSLGAGLVHHTPDHHHSMAAVCKVSRNVLFPPQFRALQEWFHYAFSCSDIDEVDRFPSVERERDRADSEGGGGGGGPARSRTPKQDLNHTREVIFALPSLQLHLKTEHWQATFTPDPTDEKPTVECSFVTEFEDHIFVTVDAEAFFFLHDLIISYIREKDRVMGYPASGRTQSPELAERRQARAPEGGGGGGEAEAGQSGGEKRRAFEVTGHNKDWRNYHCKTWHLEPTVRLLSWGGKSIEPYGVDYILQKLGFSHARSTIPKWMQRGFMDPLDKVLAVLVLNTVQLVRDEDQREGRRRR